MEELFGSNLFAIYIIACIAVISYSNFRENQRMFLLYLFTYATVFFGIFRVSAGLVLLFIVTFVFLEYLSGDAQKLSLIVRFRFKLYDYGFMMLFQYHFLCIFLAFLSLHLSHRPFPGAVRLGLTGLSLILLWAGAHLAVSQPFKIRSISEIFQAFQDFPHSAFVYSEALQRRLELICAIEDRTYFQRENSYTFSSREYLSLVGQRYPNWSFFRRLWAILAGSTMIGKPTRGFSTPEMQLLRTLGVQRGYDRHKYQRKIFEIVYSRIFFSSLRDYCQAGSDRVFVHYRQYLLCVYLRQAMTKLHGVRYEPLSTVFQNSEDPEHWSLEGLFIAGLGLSFRPANEENLALYHDVIEQFGLSEDRIQALDRAFPAERFPSEVG